MHNSVEIFPVRNSVDVSLLDIYTTTYFLQAHTTSEEHALAGVKEGGGDKV